RDAVAVEPAARLSFPSALPGGDGYLPRGAAGCDPDRRFAPGQLSSVQRNLSLERLHHTARRGAASSLRKAAMAVATDASIPLPAVALLGGEEELAPLAGDFGPRRVCCAADPR